MHRAKGITDRIQFNGRDQLVTAIFTTPTASSYSESVDHMERCLDGKSAVVKAIGKWNQRQGKIRANRLFDYTVGLHTKRSDKSDWLWSHLHLTIVVGPDVRLQTRSRDGLQDVLRRVFCNTIVVPNAYVSFAKQGRLGTKVLSQEARRALHRGKTVLFADVQKQLAYALTLAEKDDTADSIAMRTKMLQQLGSPSTFSRSRREKEDGSPSSAPADSQPHNFDPFVLSKKSVYRFGIDGGEPEQIDLADFEKQRLKLVLAAKRMLRN